MLMTIGVIGYFLFAGFSMVCLILDRKQKGVTMLDTDTAIKLLEYVNNADTQVHVDLVDEIISELYNDKYTTDTERVNGIIESIEFVTNIKISK